MLNTISSRGPLSPVFARKSDKSAEQAPIRPDQPPCMNGPHPMTVATWEGTPSRLYLSAREGSRDGYVIVDSGTARSWLKAPGRGAEFIDDAYVATVGGERMHMLGRRVPFEETHDKPIIGCVGNDYILAGVAVLDLGKGTLTRLPASARVPGSGSWLKFPIEVERGVIFTRAVVGGKPRQLQVDTGAPDTVLIGQQLSDKAHQVESGDVYNNKLVEEQTTLPLQMSDGSSRMVPVQLMESFPHLENDVGKPLGRRLDGILGLSSLGNKRIVLDRTRGQMLVEP